MIQIADDITIDECSIKYVFIRASGPGGQHVNKASTAVQLRFDVMNAPSLPDDVRKRLLRLAGSRMNMNGILVIEARQFRSQSQNREDALNRLVRLIRKAWEKPKPRKKTRPTLASKERRLKAKGRQGKLKKMRRHAPDADE